MLNSIDYAVILIYFAGILWMGYYFKNYVHTSTDYFLAGRMLPFWAIGMSIVATDIGAVDFIGLAGQAYQYGIVVGNFDWIGSVPAMILAALVFVPYYWRAGVFTIPEYLGRRYNIYVRTAHAGVWLLIFILNLGIMLWATGLLLSELMGWPIILSILLTAAVVGIYTIAGGLSAVVMTDVVQMVVMFVGASAILFLGIWQLGGWNAMVEKIISLGPQYADHFSLILSPEKNTPYPWTGILFGLALVLAPAYFIANQAIVQRSLGAKNEWHAKAGVLWGAFLKMFIPILFVVPGLIALGLLPGIEQGDRAFPALIKHLLPPGMTGLVFAAFFAGLMSSVDSALNSAATIWTKDIYERFLKRNADDAHYLKVGRIFTGVLLVFAVIAAPISSLFSGIYIYIQTIFAIFQGPTLAILLLGMFWRRTSQWGGLAGLAGGIIVASTLYIFKGSLFTIADPFLYIAWWSFVSGLVFAVIVTLLTPPEPLEKIRGLVYGLVLHDKTLQDKLRNKLEN